MVHLESNLHLTVKHLAPCGAVVPAEILVGIVCFDQELNMCTVLLIKVCRVRWQWITHCRSSAARLD